MTLEEAIKARHSVRNYKYQPLSEEVIDILQQKIDECNTLGDLQPPRSYCCQSAEVFLFDVSRLIRYAKKHGVKFNMLLCWCIGKAASQVPEFMMLPVEDKMYRFDELAIGPVVNNIKGGINYCDIPYNANLQAFNTSYEEITSKAARLCENLCLDDRMMVIGTSAMIQTELDSIVNQYAKGFNNPMVMWGKYRKGFFKVTLPISFQFHHVQMDGGQAALFLEKLQQEILELR